HISARSRRACVECALGAGTIHCDVEVRHLPRGARFFLSAGIDWKQQVDGEKADEKKQIDGSHVFVSTIGFHSCFCVSILKIANCKMKSVSLVSNLRSRRPHAN